MEVLENLEQFEWPDILNKSSNGHKKILCILDEGTPAGKAVTAIINVFEKHTRHDTIIISDDKLVVRLVKLQFDSQLRANRRYKVKDVLDDVTVLLMSINSDAVSFASAFKPDVLVVNEKSLKYFQTITACEKVVISRIK